MGDDPKQKFKILHIYDNLDILFPRIQINPFYQQEGAE